MNSNYLNSFFNSLDKNNKDDESETNDISFKTKSKSIKFTENVFNHSVLIEIHNKDYEDYDQEEYMDITLNVDLIKELHEFLGKIISE